MERFKESVHIALFNLIGNPVRSLLSILGIVIGIASVILILAFGSGARNSILDRFAPEGTIELTVYPTYDQQTQRMGQLDVEDVRRLEELPFVTSVVPGVNLMKELRTRKATQQAQIVGATAGYLHARNYHLVQGRDFSPIELEQRGRLLLINTEAAAAFFEPGDPVLGETIYVDQDPWTVIGVFSADNESVAAAKAFNFNRPPQCAAPLSTLLRMSRDGAVNQATVYAKKEEGNDATREILDAVERNDPFRHGLFRVLDADQMTTRRLDIEKSLTFTGLMIASISLIVGGIGMMNVMLTTVAERTREIGVRRAMGARRKDIVSQFLVESCLLSAAGGILGLLIGAAFSRFASVFFKSVFQAPPQIQPAFLFLSVGSGVILGVLFGFYPALKASRLSPAEALRTE